MKFTISQLFKSPYIDETLEEQERDLHKIPHYEVFAKKLKEATDEVKNGVGELGKTEFNPIPVNGPVGEIKYLGRLKTKNGQAVLFHRLGCINLDDKNIVDVFEVVSFDGSCWDVLYLDMYYPRRSIKAPAGFTVGPFDKLHSKLPIGFGIIIRDVNFPFGMGDYMEQKYDIFGDGIFGKRLRKHYEDIISNKEVFQRPAEHSEKIKQVMEKLAPTAYYQPDVNFP